MPDNTVGGPDHPPSSVDLSELFPGGSEMHRHLRELDWSRTPVGPVSSWPNSLRVLVRTILASRYPMVLTWGPELTQFYNDAYSQLIGDKHPAALGTDIRVTLAEAWDTLGPMIAEVMRTGVANWTPALLIPLERAGFREEAYFSVSHAPAYDDDGHIAGMLAVCSEVSEGVVGERRLRLLRELAESASRAWSLQTTLDQLRAVLTKYPLEVGFAQLFLRSGESDSLQLAFDVGEPATGEPAVPIEVLVRALKGEVASAYAVSRPAPRTLWGHPVVRAEVLPLTAAGRTPIGVLVVGTSPNQAPDESLKAFTQLLAGQAALSVRNAEAYEEERRRAEQLAELDRAKTAFFNNVSHELRTPLTLILGPVEEALRDLPSDSDAQQARLELIRRNAARLLKLVNTLLDFSRIEAGRMDPVFEATDLAALTRDLASQFRSAMQRAGLKFEVRVEALESPVLVDRSMWEKIVLNLLSNALKYTLRGSVTVALRGSGAEIELAVTDTGAGIRSEEQALIFDRFYRVKDSAARSHEGTGIGLSLVRDLVAFHGGNVTVQSVPDQGSTFRVTLPARPPSSSTDLDWVGVSERGSVAAQPYLEEADAWRQNEERAPTASSRPHDSASSRVLLADDNADLRAYVGSLLAPEFDVIAVADGQSALSLARSVRPDLILSDVMMPGMDGFELVRQLRSDASTRDIPVILLSARAGEESTVEGLNALADDYLTKPFSSRELLSRVRTHLELAQVRKDLAGRDALNAQLRASEQRFRRIYDANVVGILFSTFDGRVLDANDAFLRLVGYTREELQNGSIRWDELTPSEWRQRNRWAIEQLREHGVCPAFEKEYFHKDGHRVAVLLGSAALEPGDVADEVTYVLDISDRKAAEREQQRLFDAVQRARSRVERLQRVTSALGRALTRRQVAEVSLSEAGAALSSQRAALLIAVPRREQLELLASMGMEEQALTNLRVVPLSADSAIADAQREGEVILRKVSDQESLVCVPLRSDAEGTSGVIAVYSPAREELTASERVFLLALAGQCAQALGRADAFEELRSAKRLAEEASRLKDEFLATVSHELRTPLSAILGWASLLQQAQQEDFAKLAKGVEVIERNARAQQQIIEDILDVSRIVRGSLVVDPQPFDMAQLIVQTLDAHKPAAVAKGVALNVAGCEGPHLFVGDPGRIRQIVSNLVGNALKFTPSGGLVSVELDVSAASFAVRVRDTGQGMSAAFLPHVFDRFRQADSSSTRVHGGLGLGLSIVKSLTELHGGTVRAESGGLGRGSTFTVSFPVPPTRLQRAARSDDVSAALASHQSSRPLGGVRVLVVEDEPDARELLDTILSGLGAHVRSCASAEEGLEALQRIVPDLLISDIGMPGRNGYWLIERVRERHPGLAALALTAYARAEDAERARSAGFSGYMAKPIDPARLLQEVTALVSKAA